MAKRITITYKCDHSGQRLADVVKKHWDTYPAADRYCLCMRDNEKGKPMPTKMKVVSVDVVDIAPE